MAAELCQILRMVTIELVINSIRLMGIHVTISCRYCIAFEVMLLFLVLVSFCPLRQYPIPRVTPSAGALITQCWEKLVISTEIAVYLGNDMRQTDDYYEMLVGSHWVPD